jgi:hypothetical protein
MGKLFLIANQPLKFCLLGVVNAHKYSELIQATMDI